MKPYFVAPGVNTHAMGAGALVTRAGDEFPGNLNGVAPHRRAVVRHDRLQRDFYARTFIQRKLFDEGGRGPVGHARVHRQGALAGRTHGLEVHP